MLAWFAASLTPGEVAGRRVLEVGSYDVNGSVRPMVEAHGPVSYVGVDQTPGPRVDQVVPAGQLAGVFGAAAFDVVLSTEMLEHVADWQAAVAGMCEVLAPGGLLMFTTRSPGFPYHPFPVDCWRYTVDCVRGMMLAAGFRPVEVVDDPQAPGVFVRAWKPAGWVAPWRLRGLAAVFAGVAPQPVVAP